MLKDELKRNLARVEFIITASEKRMSPALPKSKRVELTNLICDAYLLRGKLLMCSGQPYRSLHPDEAVLLPLKNNTTTDSDNLKNISPNDGDLWQYHGRGKDSAPSHKQYN